MYATSVTQLIGSMVTLAAVGGCIAICITKTSARDPITGRPIWSWYGRVALTVVVTLVVAGATGAIVKAVGLGEDDEQDAVDDMRDALASRGYTSSEVNCVESAIIRDFGSVSAVVDADDATKAFTAIIVCTDELRLTPHIAECWVAKIVDHFDIAHFDAEAMVDLGLQSGDPGDRRFLAISSLTCQGVTEQLAACVVDHATEVDPTMLGDRTPGMTPDQERIMVAAARECADE